MKTNIFYLFILQCAVAGAPVTDWELYDTGYTGKSLSEALIFASTNPQYDDRLFIELQVL